MEKDISPSDHAIRVAVVASRWHSELVDRTIEGFAERLAASTPAHVDYFRVPGAFEIPLHAQRLARSGKYDAIAGCALVVDGGIYRHDFVSQTVVSGLMQVQLATDVPVFSAVLTPHHFHEHEQHVEFFDAHLRVKGEELANAVVDTVGALKALPVYIEQARAAAHA